MFKISKHCTSSCWRSVPGICTTTTDSVHECCDTQRPTSLYKCKALWLNWKQSNNAPTSSVDVNIGTIWVMAHFAFWLLFYMDKTFFNLSVAMGESKQSGEKWRKKAFHKLLRHYPKRRESFLILKHVSDLGSYGPLHQSWTCKARASSIPRIS